MDICYIASMSLHGDKLVYKNEEIRIEFICLPQTSITHLEIIPIAIKITYIQLIFQLKGDMPKYGNRLQHGLLKLRTDLLP